MTSLLVAFYNVPRTFFEEKLMATVRIQSQKPNIVREAGQRVTPATDEILAFCPKCKTFETLWFVEGVLVHTQKFNQVGTQVYHNCGSEEPCRLFPYFIKKG
jgi:hypothetical protein